jgi:hypothetical protein
MSSFSTKVMAEGSSCTSTSGNKRRQETFARAAAIAKARLAAVQAGAACAPFPNEDVQKHVFSYVGSNLWLVVGAVCQQWHFQYLLQYKWVWRQQRLDSKDTRVKHYFPTSYSAAFASVPLLELALDSAVLDLSCSTAQYNAGRYGSTATLLLLAHKYLLPLTSADVVRGAVVALDGPKLQWLVTNWDCKLPAGIDCFAARSGSVDMLKLLQQQGVLFAEQTAVAAIAAKHLLVLQYLHSQGCVISSSACDAAVVQRDLSILTFLYGIGQTLLPQATVKAAAKHGDPPLLAWSLQHGAELDEHCMVLAASSGQLFMCQLLAENGCPWTAAVTDAALQKQQTGILQWAVSAGIADLSERQQQQLTVQLLRLEELARQQRARQPEYSAASVATTLDDFDDDEYPGDGSWE